MSELGEIAVCTRCGNDWPRRVENPAQCPECKSPYWNKPRVRAVPVVTAKIETRPAKIAEIMSRPKVEAKVVAAEVPVSQNKSGITDTKCLKPNHLTFMSGEKFFCLTCSKEK